MRIICLFFALLVASVSLGQNVKITGFVKDSLSNTPLPGASLSLKSMNGAVLAVGQSGENGAFIISSAGGSESVLEISFSGYATKRMNTNAISSGETVMFMLMPANASLEEVIVRGKKPPVAFKVDRQVYQASNFGNAAGGSGIDIVKNLPSVSVNALGELAVRGSGSFLLLVNGKPTQGDPSFVLSQLPANAIENIEVITSPSAVYDADGRGGIINITTTAGVEDGWMVQGSVMGGFPPLNDFNNKANPQRYSADVSAGYRKNKWDLSGGINYLRNDIAGFREGDVFTIINNVKTTFPSMGERSFNRYNYGGRFAASYQINNRNSISAGFYRGKRYQLRVADLLYNNGKENLVTGETSSFNYFNENDQEKEGVFTLANMDYTVGFSAKSKIIFSGLYERADLTGTTTNNNLAWPGLRDTLQYTLNPSSNPLDAYRLKADYSTKLGEGTFQAGYQYRYDVQKGDFLYLTKIIGSNDFETDPGFTSGVKTVNHIHGGYAQYSANIGKWYYSGGLRLEQSDRNIQFTKDFEENAVSLANLFPSAQLRYQAWDGGSLKAGYNRRIKRTNNFELNPFPEREHSETLEQGDPNLLPELIGIWEAGLEQKLNKGSFYATLYYQRIQNPIQRVNSIFADTILNRVFTNAGSAIQAGTETNLTLNIFPLWQFVLGGNVYRYDIKGEIFGGSIPIHNSSWVYSINSTQSFSLPDNWMVQLSLNYLSLRATAQGEDGRFLTPHFTVKKATANRRWNFQFQWLYMDAGLKESNRQRITTYGSDFYTTTNYIYEPDQLQLSIGFNLSRKNRKIQLPASEMGEKEF